MLDMSALKGFDKVWADLVQEPTFGVLLAFSLFVSFTARPFLRFIRDKAARYVSSVEADLREARALLKEAKQAFAETSSETKQLSNQIARVERSAREQILHAEQMVEHAQKKMADEHERAFLARRAALHHETQTQLYEDLKRAFVATCRAEIQNTPFAPSSQALTEATDAVVRAIPRKSARSRTRT